MTNLPVATNEAILQVIDYYTAVGGGDTWRTLYLNRTTPELFCTVVINDCEWKSIWRDMMKKPLPKIPPTLGEFLPLLAGLGG